MNLAILGIRDPGDLQNERVVFEARDEVDLGDYLTSFAYETGDDTISDRMISPLWFPTMKLNVGEKVVVYSRSGTRWKKEMNDGRAIYFLYRNKREALCVNARMGVLLLKMSGWEFEMNRY